MQGCGRQSRRHGPREVIEIGLQAGRAPAPFGGPSAWSVRDRDAAGAAVSAGNDQEVTVRDEGWLHDGEAAPMASGSGETLATPSELISRTCVTAAIVTRCGEL